MEANSPLEGIQSDIEMGSIDDRLINGFEDESIFEIEFLKRTPVHSRILPIAFQERRLVHSRISPTCVLRSMRTLLRSRKLNLLMPLGPITIIVQNLSVNEGWVFVLGLLGTIPLAERLSYTTNQLAFYTGARAGGFLSATLGNAAQLITSIYALKKGMIRTVQLSFLGSILLNVLLLLGCAFFFRGPIFHRKEEKFNKATAVVGSRLLFMAVIGLLFPAIHHYVIDEVHFGKSGLALSRFNSCVMLVVYVAYLVFEPMTKKDVYNPIREEENHSTDDDDDEVPEITKWESLIWLLLLTAWLTILSDYVVNAIQGASAAWDLSVTFISIILLPFVGNASVIMFALNDKLDKALGAAIDTSTQIAMFGIPFCVVVGWIMDRPMDLNFQPLETAILLITVLVIIIFLQEKTSNYFKGLMLTLFYIIVAASFFAHKVTSSDDDKQLKT